MAWSGTKMITAGNGDQADGNPCRVAHDPRGGEILERTTDEVWWWPVEGGLLFREIGKTQAERALELFGGRLSREVRNDLAGRPRFLVGRKGAHHLRPPRIVWLERHKNVSVMAVSYPSAS